MTVTRHRHSIPTPLVEMSEIQSMSNPALKLTRSKYRALTNKGIVSPGFRIPVRTTRGLGGSRKYHSVLAMMALKAQLAGDDEGAAYLGNSARSVELQFKERIVGYLRNHPAAALPDAEFFASLLKATREALDGWRRLRDVVFAEGEVSEIDETDVRIDGITSAGESVEILLPAMLARAQEIGVGDPVWVFRILAGGSAIVEILPAVGTDEDDRGSYYLEQGAGAPISEAEAAYFKNLPEGSLPVAKVARLAG